MNFKPYLAAAAVALSPVAASAASVNINFQSFGSVAGGDVDAAGATAARDAFLGPYPIIGHEDFESFTACDGSNELTCASSPVGPGSPIESTQVGNFYGIGGTQTTGGSQIDPKENIIVRMDDPDNTFSRFDVDGDGNWLDSNDVNGINWEIPGASGLSDIIKIAFFLTDVDDVGQFDFDIDVVGDDVVSQFVSGIPTSGRPDGELQLVTMRFSKAVDILNIRMINGVGDGFGIDGIKVAAVPLPAGGLLLISALGGMALLRRRRKAA